MKRLLSLVFIFLFVSLSVFGQRFPFSSSVHLAGSGSAVDSASWEQGFKDYYYEIAEASRSGIDTADAQNTLYKRITDTADVDIMYLFAQSYKAAALINIIDPDGSFNLSDGDTITWTQYQGYTFTTNDYMNTGYDPATNGVNVDQNSIAIGSYQRTWSEGSYVSIGAEDGPDYLKIYPHSAAAGGVLLAYINNGASTYGSVSDGFGLTTGSRRASDDVEVYQNSTSISAESDASVDEVSEDLYIGASNDDGTAILFAEGEIAFVFVSEGLSDEQVTEIYTAIEQYMDYLGKGVVD